jgi:H-type small acid-soluble spore protein
MQIIFLLALKQSLNIKRSEILMQSKRVEEIISSPEKIEVLYRNNPIWIEKFNKGENTAQVTVLGSTQNMEVPVNDLVETGLVH